MYCVNERLDDRTCSKWEEEITSSNEPPSYATLWEFLSRRRQTLEALTPVDTNQPKSSSNERSHPLVSRSVCGEGRCQNQVRVEPQSIFHYAKTALVRKLTVESTGTYMNCLGNYKFSECQAKRGCFVCGERHHSSLHKAFKAYVSHAGNHINSHLTYDCRGQHRTARI